MDNVLLNKSASIERCIKRVKEEYSNSLDLFNNFTKQDSIILNIMRACETALDMGTRIIRLKKLGLPQNSRDTFVILENSGIISADLSKKMQLMIGFRNIAVHEYTSLNLDIVKSIIEHQLNDLMEFSRTLIKKTND